MAKGWNGIEHRIDLDLKDAQLRPWVFRCPKENCYYAVSADTEEAAAEKRDAHKCPYQGGITHIGGSITVTLVEDMWEKADRAFADFLEEGMSPDLAKQRGGIVRGMCEMIAIWMPPHFTTGNEVGKELQKRRAMFEAGEQYETAGLHGRRFEPPPLKGRVNTGKIAEGDRVIHTRTRQLGNVVAITADGISVKYDDAKSFGTGLSVNDLEMYKEPKAASARVTALTPEAINGIKFAVASGAFTVSQIASTYGLTDAEVTAVNNS